MSNVNKVIYGDTALLDLSDDTVTPETLAVGVTAHSADGSLIEGVATFNIDEYFTVGAPVGTIIAVMGYQVPNDYLICDGSLVSYDNYPELGDFFVRNFGTATHFGGSGKQFALPDLRNRFLRGYHGSSETLSGNVGALQEASKISRMRIMVDAASGIANLDVESVQDSVSSYGKDLIINGEPTTVGSNRYISRFQSTYIHGYGQPAEYYDVHPLNSAVLYCIKYKQPTSAFLSKEELEAILV